MFREEWDVLQAVAERRHFDGDAVEAVIEVRAEAVPVDELGEGPVRGGEDPDVDRLGTLAADRGDLALLDRAEQRHLAVRAEVGDLVEEEGPAVGQLELAEPAAAGAGERPFLVAEQLRTRTGCRGCAAVERDERPMPPRAEPVDLGGDQFLARPRLPGCRR